MKYCARFFMVLGILLLCLGCQSSSDSDSTEIVLNVPANANLIQALQEKLPEFAANTGIKVRLMPFSGQEKLFAMMAAGQAPDIFYTNTVVRERLAAENRLLDIRTVSAGDSFLYRLNPKFIERGKSIDGGWYQFCDWTFTYGVYYNQELFDHAGLTYPKPDWTWQDMVEAAKKLTIDKDHDGDIDQYGVFIARHFVSAFERMNGTEYEPNALFFSLPSEAREVQQAYLDLMHRQRVMPSLAFTQAQGMQVSQMLNTGKVAMIVESVPNLDFIHSLSVKWDVAPLPRFNGKPPLYFRAASGGLSINANCQNPLAAWETIKWLVTQSPYNSPGPVLNDTDFVTAYENKYPILKDSNFRQVWKLSEQFDGGDVRDFVRYSSWTSQAILGRLSPKLDLLYAGKISLAELEAASDEINSEARRELKNLLDNEHFNPYFKTKINEQLERETVSLE